MARLGIGRRTRQYNPGATNLAQYVQAAVEHTRGSHDAGGLIIHETPKRRNYSSATELYTKFHGRGPDKSFDISVPVTDPYDEHPEIAHLGWLEHLYVGEGVELKIRDSDGEVTQITAVEDNHWCEKLIFPDRRPSVAGEITGSQIYFAGGNQNLDDLLEKLGADPTKELLDLGFCYHIRYDTKKKFDQFRATLYQHEFGEETGVQPRLLYNRRLKLISLAGGEYEIEPAGIVN